MAQPPAKFTVLDVRDLPSPNPERIGKWDKLVVYELDPTHRYTLRVPAESFDKEALVAAVKADIQERSLWVNQSFPL